MFKSKRNRRGFTIIELMVVCFILGVLMAVGLPRFIRARFKAYDAACLSSEKNIATALESYGIDNGSTYPPLLSTLAVPNGGSTYMTSIPTCASVPGSSYQTSYEISSGFTVYTISCPGIHYIQMPEITQGFPQYQSNGTLDQFNSTN